MGRLSIVRGRLNTSSPLAAKIYRPSKRFTLTFPSAPDCPARIKQTKFFTRILSSLKFSDQPLATRILVLLTSRAKCRCILFPTAGWCLYASHRGAPAKHAGHPEYDDPCPDGQSSGPGLRIRRSRAALYGFHKIQLLLDSTGFKCSTDSSGPPSLWITG